MDQNTTPKKASSARKGATFYDQVLRLALFSAEQSKLDADDAQDFSMAFFTWKFAREDLTVPAVSGEQEDRLKKEIASSLRSYLRRRQTRTKRLVPLTGKDGREASGPAGELISREPGPEEALLLLQLRDCVEQVLPSLTDAQLDLFLCRLVEEKRLVDLQEETGSSASALTQRAYRLRLRLRHLIEANGFDLAALEAILNELDRLRGLR